MDAQVCASPDLQAAREKAPEHEPDASQVDPVVLARWNEYMFAMREAIRLMLNSQLQEAEQTLEEASKLVDQRTIMFARGEHDARGYFAFVSALMRLVHGLATLEDNQLDAVAAKVRIADELLAKDGNWAGKTVLRGLTLLLGGLVQVMQGAIPRGIWQILRSWAFLRHLETECLDFDGYERDTVRSTGLFALGVFNLLTSLLPPAMMKAAGWATGFSGGREKALEQLRMCWEEEGIQAPFAAMFLVGFTVDVSTFLGEFLEERQRRHQQAQRIIVWAAEKYPGSFFFAGLEASFLAAQRDLQGALVKFTEMSAELPAMRYLLHVRHATFSACAMEWSRAGEHFMHAVDVHKSVGRRATCPALAFVSYACYVAAGDSEKAAACLEVCLSYRQQKKKWNVLDADALKDANEASPTFRPLLFLFRRVCIVYRGVNFMTSEQVSIFLEMVRKETDACDTAADRLVGLSIQTEALRQNEDWNEVLRLAAEGLALEPQLTEPCDGALHFLLLDVAYAQYAKGNAPAAKESLAKLSALKGDTFYHKQVSFKATELGRLVGAELEDEYTEINIPARSKSRLVVNIQSPQRVEWLLLVAEYTISFVVLFHNEDGNVVELERADQHAAESGPFVGSAEVGIGKLELIFDNSFSKLRSKRVQCRVQPSGLDLRHVPEN